MPNNKNYAQRVEIIDECLRNRYRNWTLEDLIDTVNNKLTDLYGKTTSKHTIQNDIKYLREEKDAPIAKRKDGSKTYFFYSDANYSIKNLPIGSEEVEYLTDAINMLRQVSDFKILQIVDEIVIKLQNTLKTTVEGNSAIIQFEHHTTAIGTEYIDDIFSAIKEKNSLRITYQSFNAGEPKEYIYHPYLLKEYRNRWFVFGRQEAMDRITTFALDRIKKIRNSNVEYIPNDLFNPETYFNNLIGITLPEGETVQEIEILVSAKQVPYIRTKPIHHTQDIIAVHENGDVQMKMWVYNNYELRSTLLAYGCDIQVLKPLSLRENMREIFHNGLNCYK